MSATQSIALQTAGHEGEVSSYAYRYVRRRFVQDAHELPSHRPHHPSSVVHRQDRFPSARGNRDKGKPGESRRRKATRLRRPSVATPVGPPNESSEGKPHASPHLEWRGLAGRAVAGRRRLQLGQQRPGRIHSRAGHTGSTQIALTRKADTMTVDQSLQLNAIVPPVPGDDRAADQLDQLRQQRRLRHEDGGAVRPQVRTRHDHGDRRAATATRPWSP